MKLFLLAVVSCLAVSVIVKAQDCTALANAGNCDFYTQCVEARFQCGTNGYPRGYGDRYCHQFTNKQSCFTSAGQMWVNNTKICLMKAILGSDVYKSNGTCSQLETFALNNHASCNRDNGFCSDILLSATNLHCLAYEVFVWSDVWNKQAIQEVLKTATTCTKQAADSFLSSVDSWISNATQLVTRQFLQTLKNLLGGCKSGLDIIFVLDASGSVGSSNFATMKTFVNSIVSNFEIGDDKTRVGVITFSSSASIVIPLGSINNAGQLNTSITNIVYTNGFTYTNLALNLLQTAFNNSRTSQGVPRVAIVFTDGYSNSPSSTAQAAQAVHDIGIVVYSFGIGSGVNLNELNTIASSSNNVFIISNFSQSQFVEQLLPLQTTACTTPAIISISDGIQTSLSISEFRLLQYTFPDEGLTIKINIISGQLLIYGSFSVRNPTSLTADFSVQSTSTGIDYFISPDLYQSSTGGMQANRRRRQTGSPSNTTANVFLSIEGLDTNNTFSLNTTFGDTAPPIIISTTSILSTMTSTTPISTVTSTPISTPSAALGLKTPYIPLLTLVVLLFAVLQ